MKVDLYRHGTMHAILDGIVMGRKICHGTKLDRIMLILIMYIDDCMYDAYDDDFKDCEDLE